MPLPSKITRNDNSAVNVNVVIDEPTRAVFFSASDHSGRAYIYLGNALLGTISNANRTFDFDVEAEYTIAIPESGCYQAEISFFRLFDELSQELIDVISNTASSVIPVQYMQNGDTPYVNGYLSLIKKSDNTLERSLFDLSGVSIDIDENPVVPDGIWSI